MTTFTSGNINDLIKEVKDYVKEGGGAYDTAYQKRRNILVDIIISL